MNKKLFWMTFWLVFLIDFVVQHWLPSYSIILWYETILWGLCFLKWEKYFLLVDCSFVLERKYFIQKKQNFLQYFSNGDEYDLGDKIFSFNLILWNFENIRIMLEMRPTQTIIKIILSVQVSYIDLV